MDNIRTYNRAAAIEKKRKEKKKKGRPAAMTDKVLAKIEYAAATGCTVEEIALYSGVSVSCIYDYFKKHPHYKEYIDLLKNTPTLKARETVLKSIEAGDPVTAKWYLERRAPSEFTVKHDITVQSDNVLSIDERSEALSAFLSRFTE